MANGMRNASSIIQQMKYSPIKQKELQGALAAEGRDNKAVSQYDRYVGKQVAAEESRMQELDRFGAELAMRRDKLGFSKKMQKETQSMAEERLKMREDALSTKKIYQGIEGAVGILATGTEFWRGRKQKQMDELDKAYKKERILWYQQQNGTSPTGFSNLPGITQDDIDY
jgi:hypothetical protein